MIFDSANPTGGDADLGSAQRDLRRPGHRHRRRGGPAGRERRAAGQGADHLRGRRLGDPDDNAGGGTLIFTFDLRRCASTRSSILDIDEGRRRHGDRLRRRRQRHRQRARCQHLGDNSVQTVASGPPASAGSRSTSRAAARWPPSSSASEEALRGDLVRDDFDAASFGNNDGPADWAGHWIENDPVARRRSHGGQRQDHQRRAAARRLSQHRHPSRARPARSTCRAPTSRRLKLQLRHQLRRRLRRRDRGRGVRRRRCQLDAARDHHRHRRRNTGACATSTSPRSSRRRRRFASG